MALNKMAPDYVINDPEKRLVSGTLEKLLQHVEDPAHGRILNALDLPQVGGCPPHLNLASDVTAWRDTTGRAVFEKGIEVYDTEHSSWALVATRDAFHKWHLDAEGLATWLTVVSGYKLWVVGVPACHDDLGGLGMLNERIFDLDTGNKHMKYEYVLLSPGSTL